MYLLHDIHACGSTAPGHVGSHERSEVLEVCGGERRLMPITQTSVDFLVGSISSSEHLLRTFLAELDEGREYFIYASQTRWTWDETMGVLAYLLTLQAETCPQCDQPSVGPCPLHR